jgi:fucose 4-O-acetylase-like acetyltransferase
MSVGGERKNDPSISMVRLIAMCFIIACHMMQYMGWELAWWLNVGVQIFLCISGYLYGGKPVKDDIGFYRKSFSKLLLDYYVVVIPVIGIYYFFANESITVESAKAMLLLYDTISGGGHLWFVSVILLCYFLTPFYGKLFDSVEKKSTGRFFFTAVGMLLLNELIFYRFFYYFHPAWMNCYLLGFLFRRIYERRTPIVRRAVTGVVTVIGLGLNGFQIWVSYALRPELSSAEQWFYDRLCEHAHTFLGVLLFLGLKKLFSLVLRENRTMKLYGLLRFSDQYSYDIYLVHQFLILGPFTMMELTAFRWVNVTLILVCVVSLGVGVHVVSSLLRKRFERVRGAE